MIERPDPLPGFLAAAFAAATATGLYFFFWQPFSGAGAPIFRADNVMLAGVAFIAALFVAALHIGILAAPLHALLSHRTPPGPGLVLASATLIGALPIPLILQGGGEAFMLFGLVGLIGGVAFCAVNWQPGMSGEDE